MKDEQSSHRSILKSSGIVGGSQAIGIGMGMVRAKALAMILGPLGPSAVGLLGVYTTLLQFAGTVFGFGIGSSGIREISVAHANGDQEQFSRVLISVRRSLFLLGALGTIVVFAMAPTISRWCFHDVTHAREIQWLSLCVLLANIGVGQSALLQGRRMMKQLAMLGIVSAVSSTVVGVIMFSIWGITAVMPSMLVLAIIAALAGWYYTFRLPVSDSGCTWNETLGIARRLGTLGVGFLVSGVLTVGMAWLVQVVVARTHGDHALGHYNAAFRISGFLVTFVLTAMATDFFPRLAAVADQNGRVCRLINEQIEVGALLSVPPLLGMLCFADWVIPMFYSAEFDGAVPMFRWLVLGCLGRVFSWPMGSVFMAKGSTKGLVITEVLAAALHLGGLVLFLHLLGPTGAAVAFFAMYLAYFIGVYLLMRVWIGFRFDTKLVQPMLAMLVLIVAGMLVAIYCPSWVKMMTGVVTLGASAVYSSRRLIEILGADNRIVRAMRKLPFAKLLLGN